jgi:hypothetical protein
MRTKPALFARIDFDLRVDVRMHMRGEVRAKIFGKRPIKKSILSVYNFARHDMPESAHGNREQGIYSGY